MNKYVSFGVLFIAFILSGCSAFTANKDSRYNNTLSYGSSIKMAEYQCYKSLGIIKNGDYSETKSGILEFYPKTSCALDGYHSRMCEQMGGEIEKNVEYYWCVVNSTPIWGANDLIIMEKHKASLQEWTLYLKKRNYKTKNEITKIYELDNEKKDSENTYFNERLKGDSHLISKVKIGDKVCKIDSEESRHYISNPNKWIFYYGFVEKIEGNKVLIRYLGHGNSKLTIND
ncbi:hypothetical protein Q4R37_19170, partial [Morganella morganii]